ncbi:MAG: FAD-dependent oxidoreductase [Desulfobacterales bacterium]|nr:FAD-dependent oxidoreductase [Desulfobacterales bacterium]
MKNIETMKKYDAIIVGAGLAGLSAAYELSLRQKKILIFEAEKKLGGKVITRHNHGLTYELGALFAFDKKWVPFDVNAETVVTEVYPVGVYLDGNLTSEESVLSCIQKITPGLREWHCIRPFTSFASLQPQMIGTNTFEAINAFFKVIHPGEIVHYVPARRYDGLITHRISNFKQGNETLINAFVENISADICTSCNVSSLSPFENGVKVDWIKEDVKMCAISDRVILATPAMEAKQLINGFESASLVFLDKIVYGAGIVMVMGIRDANLSPYSYIVSPNRQVNTFIFHHKLNLSDAILLTAYIVADDACKCWNINDKQLSDMVLSQLNEFNIGTITSDQIIFYDTYRWPHVGPIISETAYKNFSKACLRPSDRIVLAGDYTFWNQKQMPYGMQAAIESGKIAAQMICDPIEITVSTRFLPEPLAISTVIHISESGPEYQRQINDGTIAYYGLILKSKPDIELEKYLVGESVDGLWPYQHDYTVTSLDSALVMEGLLSTRRHARLLSHSADRLVELFYNNDEKGFQTIPLNEKGRAPYWQGVDCPATAYCGWLLWQIAPDSYAAIIEECSHYLRKKQFITGRWPGKWFPSHTISTYYAVRLLSLMGSDFQKSCQQAGLFLCSQQDRFGSWNQSVIESAAAVLALNILNGSKEVIQKGCKWISSQNTGAGWFGEPILYYWLEDGLTKIHFYTRDKGKVTTAWANLALISCGF